MFRSVILILLVLLFQASNAQGIVKGLVYDSNNNEPLPFANVQIENTNYATQTDEQGNYILENIPNGLYNVKCSYVGYNTKTIFEIQISTVKPAIVDFAMDNSIKDLKEIEVKVTGFKKTPETPLSLRQIGTNEIQRNPGGNRDVSKALRTLPGVTTNNSFRNDILIRGGATSENRFYIDGVEVPVINHFSTQGGSGGPVGMMNVDFIKNVDFYSGAFPANRGNALSSVFEFEWKKPRTDRVGATFTIGASEAGVSVEGPIHEKINFLVAARQSYLQFLFKALKLPFLPTFNDFQYKVKYKIDNKNEIYMLGLGAIDRNVLNLEANETEQQRYILGYLPASYQWNYTNGLVYKHYTQKGYYTFVLSRNMLNNENRKYKNNDESNPANLILNYQSQEIENKVRAEHTLQKEDFKINYGINYEYAKYNNETKNVLNTAQGVTLIDYNAKFGLNKYGVFAQISHPNLFKSNISASLGIRADGNDYSNEMNNPLKQISPRLSLSYAINASHFLNFNTGIYYQLPAYTMMGFTSNNRLINKENHLKYIQNRHWVAGWSWNPNDYSKVSVEGFYKAYYNYPFLLNDSINAANLGADFGVIGNEPVNSSGQGNVYGIEFLAQQKLNKNIYGIATYTLSWGKFKDKTGNFAASAWDARHIVNITLGKKFKRNWEVGALFRLQSALPYTPANLQVTAQRAVWDVTGQAIKDYNLLNTKRSGVAHQLDIRIDKKWFFKKINIDVYIDIQNIYDHETSAAPIIDVMRDGTTFQPIVNPNNPNEYLIKTIGNSNGNRLTSIGLIIEI